MPFQSHSTPIRKCSKDGAFALNELRKEIPDLLPTDLSMPSGFDLLNEVQRRFPAILTIADRSAVRGR